MTTYSHNIPYFLYIKQCSHCGLKYFGYTIRKDPFKYRGSGTYWNNHMKKHGWDNLKTIDIFGFDDFESCQEFAIIFSLENNIVKDWNIWANYKDETCDSGGNHSQETKRKISNAKTGIKLTEEHKEKLKGPRPNFCGINHPNFGKHPSEETRKLLTSKKIGIKNSFYGKSHSEETKQKMKLSHHDYSGENHPLFGKHHSEETKIKNAKSQPSFDHTIREWCHHDYGLFVGTNWGLCHTFPEQKLNTRCFNSIVAGKHSRLKYKGWVLQTSKIR